LTGPIKIHAPASGVDSISSVPIPLTGWFNETKLSEATGFVLRTGASTVLITNWHVVSGRNFETKKTLSPTGGVPNLLTAALPREDRAISPIELKVALFDEVGNAKWLVHPSKHNAVDVVAIQVSIPEEASIKTCDEIKTLPIMQRVGMPVFVVGFPFGRRGYGFPVWKQGTLATEPRLAPDFEDYHLVDSASRPGMSGSLVLQRVHGLVTQENGVAGKVSGGDGAARLVGVYSGRLHTKDSEDAQLGIVWPM
jgi:Trypsin-like peptidase domain